VRIDRRAAVPVTADALTEFATALFVAAGLSGAHARTVAEVLVWANLRGVDSHGVTRIPRYLELIDCGDMNPAPQITTPTETAAAVLIDADRAAGPVAMTMASAAATRKARQVGIGLALVRATTHTGALGYYTQMAAQGGMAAIALSGSWPNMAYHGARAAGVSTSPISIAIPGGTHGPVVLDMATGIVSVGRLLQAKRSGRPLPEGWALDRDGAPTTDPAAAEIPLPLGGPKGSGLALMIEFVTSLIVSNPLLAAALEATPEGRRHRQNGLVIAIDIGRFCDPATFLHEVERLIGNLKALPRADETVEILMPGERGSRRFAERSRAGIPLPPGVLESLRGAAERRGVPMVAASS
jgi:LDH2 family malate/lactate/ureidoglycolate dehydrogenase